MTSGTRDSSIGLAVPSGGAPAAASFPALCELMADRLRTAALAVDGEGSVVLGNQSAAALFGCQLDELVGEPLGRVLELDADLEARLERALAGSGQALSVPFSAEESAPVTLTILPCRGDAAGGGALVLFETQPTSTVEDDTTHRLASLGRLSAGVAHEIRNPLSGIGTNAQVLRRRLEDDDPRVRFVDFILEEVNRLDKIIEDLLRFARPPEPRMVAHDLRESIDKVLLLTRGRIDEAGIQVELEIEGEPRQAYVDPDQVAQVLLNLVLNAIQAMPEGGDLQLQLGEVDKFGPVVGRSGRRASDGQSQGPKRLYLQIVIRDSGVGIDSADLPKLFEPFFTTRPSGTGLGLSTCQVLIRQQGGAVSVESELGKGTAVTVLIPVEKRRAAR